MKEKWGLGATFLGIFGATPFQSKVNAFFDIKRALQKGNFRSFVENGRGPDPQDPLVAHLITLIK